MSADPALDGERLVLQAASFDRQAQSLSDQASELRRMAADLRIEADRLTREPLKVVQAEPTREETDADLLGRACELLAGSGGLSGSEVADGLGLTPARGRALLLRLTDVGLVVRSGLKKGTRYALAEDRSAEPVRTFGQDYATVIRDAARKLDTFGMIDLQCELPDIAEGTLRRWVAKLEDAGTLQSERVGQRKVYGYVKPVGVPTPTRERAPTPEELALRTVGPEKPERGLAIVGTGRGERAGGAVVNELLRELRRFPQIDVIRRSHKFSFMVEGREIGSCSTTPGASGLAETRRGLRKAGIPV